MTTTTICGIAGALILGILIGVILGIARFGEQPPIGALKIRYSEPEEDPYIFLELWESAGGVEDVSKMDTVNLVVSVSARTIECVQCD